MYGAGSGTGPITGGMKGFNAATLLTRYNMKTQVIQFTGQIFCKCKIDGLTGDRSVDSVTHGIDRNASDPNGRQQRGDSYCRRCEWRIKGNYRERGLCYHDE